jgi:hypothetical protein
MAKAYPEVRRDKYPIDILTAHFVRLAVGPRHAPRTADMGGNARPADLGRTIADAL